MSGCALLGTALVLLLAGCGGSADGDAAATPSTSPAGPSGTLTVFAAASLTDVFPDLGERLEADHPGLDVQFNFAGSSALATQITQGAPADVFASANEAQMAVVTAAGLADDPQVFADNVLQIAVSAPQVPCGAAAEDVLAAAGVTAAPDTLEEDVRAALTKVELGEVDAALVYTTDVTAAGDAVEGIDVPEAEQAVNAYPVAVLADAPNPEAAAAFVELVRSAEGQQALTDAGFRVP